MTTNSVTVITLAYTPTQMYRMTHICRDGYTLCDKDTSDMECFETTIRGRHSLAEFVDCIACCRELRNH